MNQSSSRNHRRKLKKLVDNFLAHGNDEQSISDYSGVSSSDSSGETSFQQDMELGSIECSCNNSLNENIEVMSAASCCFSNSFDTSLSSPTESTSSDSGSETHVGSNVKGTLVEKL